MQNYADIIDTLISRSLILSLLVLCMNLIIRVTIYTYGLNIACN